MKDSLFGKKYIDIFKEKKKNLINEYEEQIKHLPKDQKIKAFSKKQMILLTWWSKQSPFRDKDGIICDGAIRSGKSYAMSFSFILWAMATFNEEDFIIAGKTISALERNVIKPLIKILRRRGYRVERKTSENLFTVQSSKSFNTFYLFGGKDESSQDMVQGLTAAGAYFDEVALMPESFVNQATARCSAEGSKLWFNCNPEHPEHWFKLEWLDKIRFKNLIHMHFTMDDNPSLSTEKKLKYKRMYTGVFYDRFILGLWRRASGLIYKQYADNPSNYLIGKFPIDDKLITINIGVDFGGAKSATTFVATGIGQDFKYVYVLRDKRIEKELTPEELNYAFSEFVSKVYKDYGMFMEAKCDSAESILIKGLEVTTVRNNLKCAVKKARKKDILERIRCEQALIGEKRLRIFKNEAQQTQSALLSAIWDDDKSNTRLDEVSFKNPVDILDAFEYSFEEFIDYLMIA